MKFDVLPIINEFPSDFKSFKRKYKKTLIARLALERSQWVYLRTRLAESQNWKCCFCGCYMLETHGKKNSVTVEHVTPKSQGGSDDPENLAASCYNCNNLRGIRDVKKFRPSNPNDKSKAQHRLEVKISGYVKKAKKFAEIDFKVNDIIQSFDDWFSTLRLCAKGKKMFFDEYQAANIS